MAMVAVHGRLLASRPGLLAIVFIVSLVAGWPFEMRAQTRGPVIPWKPGYRVVDGDIPRPPLPNPYLAHLPVGARPDYAHWRAWLRQQGRRRAARMKAPVKLLMLGESEPNDSSATANLLSGFGSGPGEDGAADISGFSSSPVAVLLTPLAEDEGSIPLATDTNLTPGNAVQLSATIGDGPFGNEAIGSGDFDFFRIAGVQAGQTIVIDVDTPEPSEPDSGLDSYVALYDSAGNIIAFNDDDGVSTDSFLLATAPAADDYFVSVGGFSLTLSTLADPFQSSSGLTFALGSEGDYQAIIGLDYGDDDHFLLELQAGDVLGVSGDGAIRLTQLLDGDDTERIVSLQDASDIYPATSPLPGGGNAVLAYLVEATGDYVVNAYGLHGDYNLQLRVFRPPLEQSAMGEKQILFLDFDGATVDPAIFGADPAQATLSPLVDFLPNWGLDAGDEDAVIDAIIAVVEENVDSDLRTLGNNPNFDVEIRNSRDHPDPFGQAHVSRVIIGGSTAELGLLVIGIAQSIDIGNFDTQETAVVLLDQLSDPGFNPNSLNSISLAEGASIIDLIAIGLGNSAAHEAGHFWGNFHTENLFTPPSIMDQGGNPYNFFGTGFDSTFGNEDDVDVDFAVDLYTPDENFSGLQDTLNTTAFGLTTSSGGSEPQPAGTLTGNSSFPDTLVGGRSVARVFDLTSTGNADLIVSMAMRLDDATHFLLGNNGCTEGLNLGTDGRCRARVRCTPQAAGTQTTTLRIDTNAGTFSRVLDCTGFFEQIFSDQFE